MLRRELEALGQRMTAGLSLPTGTTVTSYVEEDPDVLIFHARQTTPEHRAGHVVVSEIAIEDLGDHTALETLQYLLTILNRGELPRWPADRKSPLLGRRTSRGWELPET